MSNTEEFLKIFNEIEKHLRKLAQVDFRPSFGQIVRELIEKNSIVRSYRYDLEEYAELRNAIVHAVTKKPIAEPLPETVEAIKKIYEDLISPPRALEIASSPVYSCDINSNIIDVIKTMKKEVYTYVPVYDGREFIGVFSEASILRWLGDSVTEGGFILDKEKIGELQKYFDQPDDPFNSYKFISKDTSVFDIREEFLKFVQKRNRLGAIFITEHGAPNEKLLGIITAWDLPQIEQTN